jgi:hypothetical protein
VPGGGLGAASSRPKWAQGAHSQAEVVGVEPGALNSGFGVRGSRFRLPVWPALPDSAQCCVMVGTRGRVVPCGMFLRVARAGEMFTNNYMGIKPYRRGFGWGAW